MARWPKWATSAGAAGLAFGAAAVEGGVKFASVLPLTGGTKTIGAYYLHGYKMAFQEFEANGGLVWRGEKQDLNFDNVHVLDDQSSKTAGPKALDEFLTAASWTEQDPLVVLGGYGSSSVVGQINTTDKHGVLMVNGGGASSTMYGPRSKGGNNTKRLAFGLLADIGKMASSTMRYMMMQMDAGRLPQKPSTIALLWEASDHGEAYRREVTRFALQYPEYFQVAYAADYPYPNTLASQAFEDMAMDLFRTDQALLADRGHRINVLLVDAHSEDFIKLQDELTNLDFEFDFVTYGARGTSTKDIEKLREPQTANLTVSAQWWSASLNDDRSRDFVRQWRITQAFSWAEQLAASGGTVGLFELAGEQLEVDWYGALGYQAALVLLEALNRTADQTMSGAADHLRSTTFRGTILPGGDISFNEFGQATNDYTIVQTNLQLFKSKAGNLQVSNTQETLYPNGDPTHFQVKSVWRVKSEICGPSHMGFIMEPCDEQSQRAVRFFWVDHLGYPCEDPSKPCSCTMGSSFTLPASVSEDCEYLAMDSSNGRLIVAFASIGGCVSFCSLLVLFFHYNHVVMKAGQREFLALMCFAGIWCNIAAVSFLGPNVSDMCVTRVFSLLMSVTLLIGSLTVKVYRIYKIWNNSSMKRIVITALDMVKLLSLLMLGILIIFTVWALVQLPHAATDYVERSVGASTISLKTQVCVYSSDIVFPVVAITYVLLILLYCNVLSFQGRNSDAKYMESRSIMFASYCITFVTALVLILAAAADLPMVSLILLISLSLIFTSVMFVGVVLGPKMYFATQPGIEGVKRSIERRLKSGKNSSMTSDAAISKTHTQSLLDAREVDTVHPVDVKLDNAGVGDASPLPPSMVGLDALPNNLDGAKGLAKHCSSESHDSTSAEEDGSSKAASPSNAAARVQFAMATLGSDRTIHEEEDGTPEPSAEIHNTTSMSAV